jgi:hypothetical protein
MNRSELVVELVKQAADRGDASARLWLARRSSRLERYEADVDAGKPINFESWSKQMKGMRKAS